MRTISRFVVILAAAVFFVVAGCGEQAEQDTISVTLIEEGMDAPLPVMRCIVDCQQTVLADSGHYLAGFITSDSNALPFEECFDLEIRGHWHYYTDEPSVFAECEFGAVPTLVAGLLYDDDEDLICAVVMNNEKEYNVAYPADVPDYVKRVKAAANKILRKLYTLGGPSRAAA